MYKLLWCFSFESWQLSDWGKVDFSTFCSTSFCVFQPSNQPCRQLTEWDSAAAPFLFNFSYRANKTGLSCLMQKFQEIIMRSHCAAYDFSNCDTFLRVICSLSESDTGPSVFCFTLGFLEGGISPQLSQVRSQKACHYSLRGCINDVTKMRGKRDR